MVAKAKIKMAAATTAAGVSMCEEWLVQCKQRWGELSFQRASGADSGLAKVSGSCGAMGQFSQCGLF